MPPGELFDLIGKPPATQYLEDFLELHVRSYKVPMLLQSGAVVVVRKEAVKITRDPRFLVRTTDHIGIISPYPAVYQTFLDRIDSPKFLDYTSDLQTGGNFTDLFRRAYDTRPQTKFLDYLRSLSGLVKDLNSASGKISSPIRNLIIIAHGYSTGWLGLRMDDYETKLKPSITYEDLLDAKQKGALRNSGESLNPQPKDKNGQTLLPTLLIHGCLVGNAPEFLRVLKEALGGRLLVTGCKYFVRITPVSTPTEQRGWLENLEYYFRLDRPKAFRNKTEAVDAFLQEVKHRQNRKDAVDRWDLVDGSRITRRLLDRWITDRMDRDEETIEEPISSPFRMRLNGSYTHREETLVERGVGSKKLASEPLSDEDRKRVFREWLIESNPLFSPKVRVPVA